MLYISSEKNLSNLLRVTRDELWDMLEHADDYYDELKLHDPAKPDKPRDIVCVTGKLRRLQIRFYRDVLLARLPISPYSHGGIRGRSARTNAAVHLHSHFIFKTDISSFFPSIRQWQIYRLFVDRFGCTPPVAALCTRLCTYDNCLQLGLITSPILADQFVRPIDKRIGILCERCRLKYSRYVDDITISGKYDIKRSGIPRVIAKILLQNGLRANPEKNEFGRVRDGIAVTGIRRNRRGKIDVEQEYADEIARVLDDVKSLSDGKPFDKSRPYFTRDQIRGRIQFVKTVNIGRGQRLLNRFHEIKWELVAAAAHEQALIVSKKQITQRNEKPAPIRA